MIGILFAFISVGLLDEHIFHYCALNVHKHMVSAYSIRAAKIQRAGSSCLCCGHCSHVFFPLLFWRYDEGHASIAILISYWQKSADNCTNLNLE